MPSSYTVGYDGAHLRIYKVDWGTGPASTETVRFTRSEPLSHSGSRGKLTVGDVLVIMSCIPAYTLFSADSTGDPYPDDPLPWLQDVCKEYQGQMYCLIDVLGEGATARVSCYSKGSDVVVIKSVKSRERLGDIYDASARALLNEKSMLTTLAEHNPSDAEHVWVAPESVIPRIAFDLGSDVDICLTPLCEPFIFPTNSLARKTIVHDILSALFHAACLGLVHRDVRPDNIMLREDDPCRAMLIDWGFAVPEGIPVVYQGTGVFASQRVLLARHEARSNASGKEFSVFPADDVCSLVKVLASLDLAQTFLPRKQAAFDQYTFWEKALNGRLSGYMSAYKLAEQLLEQSTRSLSARYKEVEMKIFEIIGDDGCLHSILEEG